ncbi:uncharacterized protein LOC132060793 [Lycium ferocissimum]|uniref:uncharacterized protein LOC132060793 n=1 Tax=Lycium ferocissimum TaxID=112874 RepID=UPI0028164C08|nr:uncharacterized protein LOC132060793 [Lycium ferocissimum]
MEGRVEFGLTRPDSSVPSTRSVHDPPVKKRKRVVVEKGESSSDVRTPIKDLRAHRVFSPATHIVLQNDDISFKKCEIPLFDGENVDDLGVKECGETGNDDINLKKSGVGVEVNGENVDIFGKNENEGVGKIGITVSIPKSNLAVSSSLRRKVFIAPSSFSYRRLLPYLTDAAREYSDVSEIDTRDASSKSSDPTLSYLKPELQSTASNGSASDVSKTLGGVEGQKIVPNVSGGPQDLNEIPDVLSQTQVESRVFTNAGGLNPEALDECVQTTPPDADIFCKANVSHNSEQMEKFFAGHPSDRNGCNVKKSNLTPGKNGSVSKNKLALNPCSRLKVFKAASSVSYRRLLPFLMDVAKSDSGGASSENGLPKFQRDLECNRPFLSVSKKVPTNKEYSPKKEEIKEQGTKLLEPKCTSANDVSESFNKMPRSVFPDDLANSQTLLNVEIERKSEAECADTSNAEKLVVPECLKNEINSFNTGANNVRPETSVSIPNLLPISLEDLLSEYGVEDPKVEPVSPEGDRMALEVDCNEESKSSGDPTGTVEIHAHANEALKKELFLKVSEPEATNNESSCKVLLADSNGDSGGLNAVALITASSSTEPSDISGYGNDGPTKTLCSELIQEISQSSDNLNKNGCLEPAICHQKSTQNDSSYDLVTHPDALNKGILKRNPRGCRGLCNCLNCASYRLHAERAFEFSRNQMQDTEEVSLGLMKELADMRIFLEKHLSTENSLAPIPLTQLEVEEACTKALEAEQRAKERLSQMNNELNYHCRVPSLYRPRVRFAAHIEGKTVAEIESSSSKSENEDIKAGTKRTRKKHH